MKLRLLLGIVIGGIIGYSLHFIFDPSRGTIDESIVGATQWDWPDSLDALQAASDYHRLVFENDDMRVLEVTIEPGQLDPIHTHKGKSIVWVVETSPIVYNTYGLSTGNKLALIRKDTINVKPEELNKGSWENPEPPHSVENVGNDTFKLYRIEYKKL